MTMTNEEIQALQALSDKATKGPAEWDAGVVPPDGPERYSTIYVHSEDEECNVGETIIAEVNHCIPEGDDNARYIMGAYNAVPALCADLLAARAENARLREALGPFAEAASGISIYDSDHEVAAPVFPVRVGDLRRARAALEGGK